MSMIALAFLGVGRPLAGQDLSTTSRAAEAQSQSQSIERKVASVLPTPAEDRWLQIPWRTHLMQARVEAQRIGKPMFLWIMDGHPLGCT